ncbi:hypothetical protein J7T55_008648 [Diaporthe amygdali]|uniref:uncharacterized protein n=1 Tax=Phomopsis amygdali TaxID=1214568 RepID=UPI0022FDDD85|nr:uncharacterized protein J7T55_008648 [Diaporthe amygdali]KAJ0121484.1 hypothetical protein J7T55_008648 [Diaporthe amygdali]
MASSSSRSMLSGSSSSSYVSSSLAVPSLSRTHSHLTQTPTSSSVSAVTYEPSIPVTPLRPLDLGPPGYQATITLFERTPHERTVYLGPWEVIEGDTRRVVWQSSYQGETLEQFLPLGLPTQAQPVTLHGQHRPFSDPAESELLVTFREPYRIRYTTADGTVVHDEVVEVIYEFTSIEGSMRFQGDLRRQDLVDYFDVDVVFSDTHGRTDSLSGAVRGLATIQRVKLWRDRLSLHHCLTFYSDKPSNRRERRYREYQVIDFQGELRNRDDKHREYRLSAVGRRGSAPNAVRARSFSISSPSSWRSKSRSAERGSDTSQVSTTTLPLDIRWLGVRFTREIDYRRFADQWTFCHIADGALRGLPFPPNHIELPLPAIRTGQVAYELDATESARSLPNMPTVLEPRSDDGAS